MPYDPANFSFGYSSSDNYTRNATTEYDRQTNQRLTASYAYKSPLKPWQPFKKKDSKQQQTGKQQPTAKTQQSGNSILDELQINFLPTNLALNSDINRNYFEQQLRDVSNMETAAPMPASFREDFYWSRSMVLNWDLTKNLRFNLNTGTNAQIEAPHVQVNKRFNMNDYELWKDSVLTSLRDFGSPMDYKQTFSATYQVPFKVIPALNFMSADLKYDAQYDWQRGATVDIPDVEIGNKISNERTFGINNGSINLLSLYNKSKFLSDANKKFTLNKTPVRSANQRPNTAAQSQANNQKRKYEASVQLNPDSASVVKHGLNNKRLRITAKDDKGKLYTLKYKTVDANTIRINNKDSVALKLTVSQLPPLDDETWYKLAQAAARGLMMVRNINFSYNLTDGMMIPGFRPAIGDFFGQGNTSFGSAPGLDFAFGLSGEDYIEKAAARDWLVTGDQANITPAYYNRTETFTMNATVEPFAGLKITLNANRVSTAQNQIDYMYDGMPKRFSGNFNMTTIALSSAFEKSKAGNGYNSESFNRFLANRERIAQRIDQQYSEVMSSSVAIERNASDVLIPAFIAAYTGQDPNKVSLNFFPGLFRVLPNWNATYEGLIQIPIIKKHFKTFNLEHAYTCRYAIGSYTSYTGWQEIADGVGYIRNTLDQIVPTSPYDVTSVSITENFDPLIRINSVLQNNMTFKLNYTIQRSVNLNIAAYQIVEMNTTDIGGDLGYRIDNFNKIIGFPKKSPPNFNNELRISGGVSYRMTQSLNRKIQDALTLPTTGNSQTTIKFTADYTVSRMITLQAYFDRQVSRPLVSAVAFPQTQSAFGISLKVNLLQ